MRAEGHEIISVASHEEICKKKKKKREREKLITKVSIIHQAVTKIFRKIHSSLKCMSLWGDY